MEETVKQFFSFFVPLFFVLFASVFVWFGLTSRLYKILATDHPQKYEAMGKPTLFWNNSPRSGWLLVKFIMTREYLALGNQRLVKLGNFMFGFFVVYGVLFSVLFVAVLWVIFYVRSHISP
ncbi:MAG: hypothetical protein AMJ84_01480 [Acidithiobacillales bacterium SM23_46]|jgi:hypothetical protein|nr:MAG: hypothetical protein AMS22_06015 [Thiotrichales bacterium SG8_50]KPK73860.1 MAG: hypothetical protein AMJ84_01480 [Acidithiobacillales bacterium SM23_46]